jgi:sec-independent protein translocase protein TatA
MIGLGEALVIGGVVVAIFGASRIPKLARYFGEGLKEFKKALREVRTQEEDTPHANGSVAEPGKASKAE